MQKVLFLITVFISVVGCGGGGGGGSSAKSDPITPQPSGNLIMQSERDGTSGDLTNVFQNCDGNSLKLDSRMKVGSSVTVDYAMFAQDSNFIDVTLGLKVKSIDSDKQTFVADATALNVPGAPAGWTGQENCHLTAQGIQCDDSGPSPSIGTSNTGDQSCEVESTGNPPPILRFGEGQFQFKNTGKAVSIKEFKMQASGNLVCNSKDTGQTATQKLTLLTTTDLPAIMTGEGFGCGSDMVFMYQQITDSSGVVHLSRKLELLSQDNP